MRIHDRIVVIKQVDAIRIIDLAVMNAPIHQHLHQDVVDQKHLVVVDWLNEVSGHQWHHEAVWNLLHHNDLPMGVRVVD